MRTDLKSLIASLLLLALIVTVAAPALAKQAEKGNASTVAAKEIANNATASKTASSKVTINSSMPSNATSKNITVMSSRIGNVTAANATAANATAANMTAPSAPAGNLTFSNATHQAQSVTVNLTARGIAFDQSRITIPAGSEVTVNFDNQDAGIPHNLAVYTDQFANKTIFKGEIITGPRKTTYTFTAPSQPGMYFFRCDVHPLQMTGEFIAK